MTRVYLDQPVSFLGATRASVEESHRRGRLRSSVQSFGDAGFVAHYVCPPEQSTLDLAAGALAQLEGLTQTDALFHATCLPRNGALNGVDRFSTSRDVKDLMDFPLSRLQVQFGLERAQLFGITQQACTGLLGALRMATWMLRAEPDLHQAVCVTADRFPEGAIYEQAYNLISDGAAACTVSTRPGAYEILGGHGVANGALARANDDETVGAFFPWAHRAITEALARLDLDIDAIDRVIPQNTNPNAWRILAQVLRMDPERVAMPTLAEMGHMISGDNLVNLAAMTPTIRRGEKVLLFMAGYGLHWQVVLLERQ